MKVLLLFQRGQLGHGDTLQRDRPTVISELSKYVLCNSLLVSRLIDAVVGDLYVKSFCSFFLKKVHIFQVSNNH